MMGRGHERTLRATAIVGVVAISFSAIFVRLAAVTPITATVFRALYGLPFLWWLDRRFGGRRPLRERSLAFAAGIALAVDLTFFHTAIGHIGAGLATLLANTQVVFVALGAWFMHRERPTAAAFSAIPLVLVGAALVSGLGRADAYGSAPGLGVVFGLLSGVFYALFLLTFRSANRSLAPGPGPLFDVTVGTALAGLLIGAATGGLDLQPTWPAHGWLLLLAVVAQVGGWLAIGHALPRLAALETSFLILLQPVLTLVWGALLFGERPSSVQAIGAALVLAGIAWVTLRGATQRQAAPAP